MSERDTWHQTKEITTRLKEPIKFKLVPYKTSKESGHQIQVEFNLDWSQIDSIKDKNGPIVQGISNCIKIIEDDLKSTYLGTVRSGDVKNE